MYNHPGWEVPYCYLAPNVIVSILIVPLITMPQWPKNIRLSLFRFPNWELDGRVYFKCMVKLGSLYLELIRGWGVRSRVYSRGRSVARLAILDIYQHLLSLWRSCYISRAPAKAPTSRTVSYCFSLDAGAGEWQMLPSQTSASRRDKSHRTTALITEGATPNLKWTYLTESTGRSQTLGAKEQPPIRVLNITPCPGSSKPRKHQSIRNEDG